MAICGKIGLPGFERTSVKIVLIPERIEVVVGLDAETRALLHRMLDIAEQPAKLTALAARLKASRERLESVLVKTPDPDPND